MYVAASAVAELGQERARRHPARAPVLLDRPRAQLHRQRMAAQLVQQRPHLAARAAACRRCRLIERQRLRLVQGPELRRDRIRAAARRDKQPQLQGAELGVLRLRAELIEVPGPAAQAVYYEQAVLVPVLEYVEPAAVVPLFPGRARGGPAQARELHAQHRLAQAAAARDKVHVQAAALHPAPEGLCKLSLAHAPYAPDPQRLAARVEVGLEPGQLLFPAGLAEIRAAGKALGQAVLRREHQPLQLEQVVEHLARPGIALPRLCGQGSAQQAHEPRGRLAVEAAALRLTACERRRQPAAQRQGLAPGLTVALAPQQVHEHAAR